MHTIRPITALLITGLLILPLLLSGCARYVKKAHYAPAIDIPYDAAPVPVLFREVELLLPVGMDVGFETHGSRGCGWPRYPVSRTVLRGAIDRKFIRQTFHDALEAQGYDVVASLDIAYDLEDEIERAEYSITAKIKDVQLEMCHREADNLMILFTTRRGIEGELYMKVDWTVYDSLRRTVVYKTTTEGYTRRRVPNQEGLTLMFSDAFEMAAHNLGTDRPFHDLLVNGIKPQDWRGRPGFPRDRRTERAPQFDPNEAVIITQDALSRTPFTRDIEDKRRVAVMVEKFGHGSGFFISDEGHILTNAHVVGDGLRTRIITANRDEKLVAEILRIDKARDVALLKLEEVPDNLDIVTLPIREDWPAVGEEVYAIGAPRDRRQLTDTVTRGIISAHREDMRFLGVRQNFLQADVEIHGGNSGGPLIDGHGNIVGMAVGATIAPPNKAGIGLNYFIPIAEALQVMDIGLESRSGAPTRITP